jgi:hypothetical protein
MVDFDALAIAVSQCRDAASPVTATASSAQGRPRW